jgi:Uma2 family endonuclease
MDAMVAPIGFDTVALPRVALPMRVRPAVPLSNDALYELCEANRNLRIERTAEGDLLIMSPTGGETGRRNATLMIAFGSWAVKDATGVVFDSSTGFVLPNGAQRAPDLAWVRRERWDALTRAQRERFPPLCPDFVVELRSASDSIDEQHAKLREYIANGAKLGWLIDPESRRVWIYRPEGEVEVLDSPARIDGAPLLPGFVLDPTPIW